jgi:mannose-6-phosphate isomerase-like protein (cupin superfamily)
MARSTVQVDNERVRVTEWRLGAGEATGWHRHELDYVIVPLTAATMRVDDGREVVERPLTPGESYFRPAGAEHDVSNPGPGELAFVEIELKEV